MSLFIRTLTPQNGDWLNDGLSYHIGTMGFRLEETVTVFVKPLRCYTVTGRVGVSSYPDPEEPDAHVANASHGCEHKVHGYDCDQNVVQREHLWNKNKLSNERVKFNQTWRV